MNKVRLLSLSSLALITLSLMGCPPPWPKCESNDHCKENRETGQVLTYVCVEGTCKECAIDGDCAEGFVCRSNACEPKPECTTNAQCTGGLICRAEKCVPECTADAACGQGMKCEGSRCVPDVECTGDSGCPEGEVCNATGECEAAPEPEITCTLETVFFDFNSDNLSGEAQRTLDANADCIRQKGASVRLDGHADERGTEEYNLQLGERRASAAKKYLTNLGVDGSSLQTNSYGEERPATSGSDEGSWAQNRRVEFTER